VYYATLLRGASNAKAKRKMGFAPRRLESASENLSDEEPIKKAQGGAMTKVLIASCLAAAAAAAQQAKVTPLMTKDLTGIPGKEGTMVTVEYPPGGSSAEHRHNAHTFVYVLEGAVVMQVKGEKEVTLGPGQTFYESPEDVHTVSRNASTSKPAKFLVFFVKEKGAPASVSAK
jgi:quercetin dioxygenase-like cupin family protein